MAGELASICIDHCHRDEQNPVTDLLWGGKLGGGDQKVGLGGHLHFMIRHLELSDGHDVQISPIQTLNTGYCGCVSFRPLPRLWAGPQGCGLQEAREAT